MNHLLHKLITTRVSFFNEINRISILAGKADLTSAALLIHNIRITSKDLPRQRKMLGKIIRYIHLYGFLLL